MQRWNPPYMLEIGQKLFAKIHAKKRFKHHNSEVHFLAREVEDWLPQGVESLVQGKYSSRHLSRYYFEDEMVAQLYTMNSNCVHVYGPTIPHVNLIQDIRRIYDDIKVQHMLESIYLKPLDDA